MTTLIGRSIVLREFRAEDVPDAFQVIGDDRVTYWLSFDSRDEPAAELMVRGAIERAAAVPRTEYYLAIASSHTDVLVGFIRLALTGVKAAKLGYAVRADDWGRGYASEAVDLMLSHAFESLGLHRVTVAIGPDNIRSISLAEKFGFRYEGRLRDHVFTNGAWRDSLLYSVLTQERRALKGPGRAPAAGDSL
jgi:RimJ/RimL family protein N-acetyltransferase